MTFVGFIALAALALASALAASCSGSSEGSALPACEELSGKCGAQCEADADCPSGLYCNAAGECTADCTPSGGQCGAGEFCDTNGRCQGGVIGLDGSAGGGGDSGGEACIAETVTFEKLTPTVVLLIDQSGSMNESFGGGDRWGVLYSALMDPTNGVVARLETQVRFGLALYTSNDGFAGGTCPILTDVSAAVGNFQAIDAVYGPATPGDETPTGESITAVAAELVALTDPGPKVIVVATDGEPDTCAEPNPQNGQAVAIQAAQNAYAQGVRTYAISVGEGSVSLGHLQDLANAGVGNPVGGPQNAPYYEVNDQQALVDAFDNIIDGVLDCVLHINGQVVPQDAALGSVLLDGAPLGLDDPNGWHMTSPSEIELLGTACDQIQSGTHEVSISFPCGVVQPPPR